MVRPASPAKSAPSGESVAVHSVGASSRKGEEGKANARAARSLRSRRRRSEHRRADAEIVEAFVPDEEEDVEIDIVVEQKKRKTALVTAMIPNEKRKLAPIFKKRTKKKTDTGVVDLTADTPQSNRKSKKCIE